MNLKYPLERQPPVPAVLLSQSRPDGDHKNPCPCWESIHVVAGLLSYHYRLSSGTLRRSLAETDPNFIIILKQNPDIRSFPTFLWQIFVILKEFSTVFISRLAAWLYYDGN